MTAGEQWAAAELDELRAGRFGPRAWLRFLRASLQRACEAREARPELAHQARTWYGAGLGTGIAVCACPRVPAPRAIKFAGWWLASCAMLDWHLGMVEGPGGEQRDRLRAADALTLTRVSMVPFLAVHGDPEQRSGPAFSALLILAGATDAADGILARRTGETRLGRDLDPIADALTSAAAARAAWKAGWLPAGAAALCAARSAIPLTSVAAGYFRTARRPPTDALRATRPLSPVLLAGLVAAPFSARTGAALTSAAAIGSAVLAWCPRGIGLAS